MALFNVQKFLNRQKAELEQARPAEDIAREWRNQELKDTDWVVSITDHSERVDYLTYREALRDWPSTDDFPNTRPTL